MNVLQRMPANLPMLGTTATANDRVLNDVIAQLGDLRVQRGSLMRRSLTLQTLRLPDQAARLAWLAEHVPALPGTGIIYTLTKRDAEQVAGWLNGRGIEARAYHSDVEAQDGAGSADSRQQLEDLLLDNQIKALVATTALGMGYDKPDLGFVVHYQAPGSVVAYYQQVGRAGRAIAHAVGVLMSGREDGEIHDYFRNSAFPDEAHVTAILDALAAGDGMSEARIEKTVNLRRGQIEKVLKFLSVDNPSPVMKEGSRWMRTPLPYSLDHEQIRRLTRQREQEWQEVQAYIDTPECLMVFLARALDDADPRPCGKCSRCLGRPVIDESFDHRLAVAASLYLRHADLALDCRKQVPLGAFPHYGFAGRLKTLQAEDGRTLSRWGDAGWGRLVAEDKRAGRFRDELVVAVVEMIRDRWRPEPAPAWVTCIPSRRHPTLVPDFARRLAQRLGLPFVAAVDKAIDSLPQKLQQNSFHQCPQPGRRLRGFRRHPVRTGAARRRCRGLRLDDDGRRSSPASSWERSGLAGGAGGGEHGRLT